MRLIRIFFSIIWKLYIGFLFVITLLVFYPLIFPCLFSEKGKAFSMRLFTTWSRLWMLLCFYRFERLSNNPLPDGPFIIVANHSSYLDIFMMPALMAKNKYLFLGKSEILNYPLIKTFFKRLNIPVFRDNPVKAGKSLVRARQELKKGWSLVIFAEGEIPDNDSPKMIPFKDGAFRLAKKAKVPIVPITFLTNYRLLSDPDNLKGPASPGASKLHIHPYISQEEVISSTQDELTLKCFDIINEPILKQFPEFRN